MPLSTLAAIFTFVGPTSTCFHSDLHMNSPAVHAEHVKGRGEMSLFLFKSPFAIVLSHNGKPARARPSREGEASFESLEKRFLRHENNEKLRQMDPCEFKTAWSTYWVPRQPWWPCLQNPKTKRSDSESDRWRERATMRGMSWGRLAEVPPTSATFRAIPQAKFF